MTSKVEYMLQKTRTKEEVFLFCLTNIKQHIELVSSWLDPSEYDLKQTSQEFCTRYNQLRVKLGVSNRSAFDRLVQRERGEKPRELKLVVDYGVFVIELLTLQEGITRFLRSSTLSF
jgi:hypothetical protein